MFLSAQEIAASREHALNHLLGLSASLLHGGQRLNELLAAAGRASIEQGSRHWSALGHGQVESLTRFPASLWLDALARSSELLEGTWAIVGDTQKALLRTSEGQIRVIDEIVFASLRHAEKNSPPEAELALGALRKTLAGAERTLQEINAAAIEGVEMRQLSAALGEPRAPRRRSRNAA